MLYIHAGREKLDKERFLYDNIAGRSLVLVPNQYTLVAEEQALKYTGRTCLWDIEILSMNRLGLRLLTEQGQESVPMLSRNGRSMLLERIIRRHRDELSLFRSAAGKASFTEMLSDFISEFKQQNCSVEELLALAAREDADPILRDKLHELEGILREYEAALEGRCTDSEDYIERYIAAIDSSEWIRQQSIWIYGYDTATPKFIDAAIKLAGRARELHWIINRSDYELDKTLENRIAMEAARAGVEVVSGEIGSEYEVARSASVKAIEEGLTADSITAVPLPSDEDIRVVECANMYYEAENAAAYVRGLLRDNNYRMKDITIICNDTEVMQPIVQRVFGEYGLDMFVDSSRRLTDCAPVCFITALLELTRYPYRTESIMKLLKTGFSGFDRDQIEKLEIYQKRYKIRRTMWERPFKYGAAEYGEEEFGALEAMRGELSSRLKGLEELKSCSTVAAWIEGFRNYLENVWELTAVLNEWITLEENMGELDEALRTRGSITECMEVLGQLEQIMGEDPFDAEEVCDILEAGLTQLAISIIPPSQDGILMGTMVRTRPRPAKAVIVLGANEGILPKQPAPEGLFSVDERNYFKENDWVLGSLDDVKMLEENVAIYRMLSKATEKLYISYSMTGADGNSLTPSMVIESIQELFPALEIEKDIVSQGFGEQLVSYSHESIRHLITHLKDRNTTHMDALTAGLMDYFGETEPDLLDRLMKAACDDNSTEALGRELARKLLARGNGDFVLSASGIQNYRECPFRYYIDRGLAPYEDRVFESDPRSIGDMYHNCLMKVGELIRGGDERPAEELVDEALAELAAEYNEGLFEAFPVEGYRLSRIREIVLAAARAMITQLTIGTVESVSFETPFGRGRELAPVELQIDGETMRIEGIIDRLDIMKGGKARIVDYKTGSDKLDLNKLRSGYKMQLAIYLLSATSGEYEPAGMFYFNISQNDQSADSMNASKLKALENSTLEDEFKLRGSAIGGEPGLQLMPEEVLYGKKHSALSMEEFEEVKSDVLDRLKETGDGIINGRIDISPLKDKNVLSCRYCRYKAICRYEASSYRGNRPRSL